MVGNDGVHIQTDGEIEMTDPMPMYFAAVNAVEEGRIAEAEVDWSITHEDGSEERLTVTVRNEVKHFKMDPSGD